LTSEELLIERKDGVERRNWRLKKRMLNEALDCRVYSYAALHGLYQVRQLNLEKRAATLFEMAAQLARGGKAEVEEQPRRRTIPVHGLTPSVSPRRSAGPDPGATGTPSARVKP
jgi:phage terminase large subunit GpA-like protein